MYARVVIVLSCLLSVGSLATGQTRTWDGNGGSPPDGTFGVAGNWNPNLVPGVGNTAVFDIADTYTVTLDGNEASDVLDLNGGDVTLASDGATVRTYDLLTGEGDLNVDGGTLRVGTAGMPVDVNVGDVISVGTNVSGDVVVSGLGSRLDGSAGSAQHNVGLNGQTASLTFEDEAAGTIGGTLHVGNSSFDTTVGNFTVMSNAEVEIGDLKVATFLSEATGTVTLDEFFDTAVTQTGNSTVEVGSSSGGAGLIDIDSGTFTTGTGGTTVAATGTIKAVGGVYRANGPVDVDGGTLEATFEGFQLADGLTMKATNDALVNLVAPYDIKGNTTYEILSGSDLQSSFFMWIGGLGLGDGTLVVDGTGSSVTIGNLVGFNTSIWGGDGDTADVTFRNNATGDVEGIDLAATSDAGTTGILRVESGAEVTMDQFRIASNGGATTSGTATIDGSGSMISQTGSSTLTVGHSATGTAELTVQNGGTFTSGTGAATVATTGTVNVGVVGGGTFNANGPMTVAGTVNLAGGEMNAASITMSGGTFAFTGGSLSVDTFTGNLDNQGGALVPGDSPGVTNITGDYTNGSTASVEIEIESAGGVAGTDHDQVNVTGAATLEGTLEVSFLDGFFPTPGDEFAVMTYGSASGEFATLDGAGLLNDDVALVPVYSATEMTLVTAIAGDVNLDGVVNALDANIVSLNWLNSGAAYGDGDANLDGTVNALDANILSLNWLEEVTAAAVPEPGGMLLWMVGCLTLWSRRRRIG